jgi:hypothetical protein
MFPFSGDLILIEGFHEPAEIEQAAAAAVSARISIQRVDMIKHWLGWPKSVLTDVVRFFRQC